MEPTPDHPATLDVGTLSDALAIGLDLVDLFGADTDFCAVWLGDDGVRRDLVICTDDRGRDVSRLIRDACISIGMLDASQVVLWRTAADLTDAPRLAGDYFVHSADVEAAGATLVDEIVLGGDELRSLAVTTFTDAPGWDDVSDRIADLGGEETSVKWH